MVDKLTNYSSLPSNESGLETEQSNKWKEEFFKISEPPSLAKWHFEALCFLVCRLDTEADILLVPAGEGHSSV